MSNNALFQGVKEFFVPSKTKDNAQKEKKTKQKKTKQKLIRRVWGQVRSPFGQPHLTLKPCKPNQKHKTQKQNMRIKTKQKQKKTNKEGLGPSEVALWATSPDP